MSSPQASQRSLHHWDKTLEAYFDDIQLVGEIPVTPADIEKLDIQDMQVNGNKTISRGIADVAWGQFVQFTTYKAENAGRGIALINPRGTTQTCSGCGSIVPKDLSVRIHDCPHCGLKLSRDHNAALNILARGLASINTTSVDEVVEAPGFSRGE